MHVARSSKRACRHRLTAHRGVGLLLLGALLGGCANAYETRFEPNPNLPAEAVVRSREPTVFHIGSDPVLDSIDMRDRGFALLGRSYFDRPGQSVMENQARAAGVAEVIVYRRQDDRHDDGTGFGVGVGVGLKSGSIGYHTGGLFGGSHYGREFPDPAPGYRYMATYWVRTQPGSGGG